MVSDLVQCIHTITFGAGVSDNNLVYFIVSFLWIHLWKAIRFYQRVHKNEYKIYLFKYFHNKI